MNEKVLELAKQAGMWEVIHFPHLTDAEAQSIEQFAKLIVKECINTLEFHGFEDTIPYIKWMATNKLGQRF